MVEIKKFDEKYLEGYLKAFYECDKKSKYFTNSFEDYPMEEVEKFYINCIKDDNRHDFLILDNDIVIGEVIINEYDDVSNSANFRICIFYEKYYNKGIGSYATKLIIKYAFEELKLNRLSLNVFSFNDRAIAMYQKLGFIREGILRDAMKNKDGYADIICMAILMKDYVKMK